jgi:hypothetical protein
MPEPMLELKFLKKGPPEDEISWHVVARPPGMSEARWTKVQVAVSAKVATVLGDNLLRMHPHLLDHLSIGIPIGFCETEDWRDLMGWVKLHLA